jgi:hypothetical protein
MRAVISIESGTLSLNWQWLPTWVGMNTPLHKELDKELDRFKGSPLTGEILDEAHLVVITFLEKRFRITGLDRYLDALKFVEL